MTQTTKESLERSFIELGEKERLKELLSQRLHESGWTSQVQNQCKAVIQEKGVDNISLEELISEVTGAARRSVPESVKRELLQHIRNFLQQQTGITDL